MPPYTITPFPLRARFVNTSRRSLLSRLQYNIPLGPSRVKLFSMVKRTLHQNTPALRIIFSAHFRRSTTTRLVKAGRTLRLPNFFSGRCCSTGCTIRTDTFIPVFATTILAVMPGDRAAFTTTRFRFSLNFCGLPAAFRFFGLDLLL